LTGPETIVGVPATGGALGLTVSVVLNEAWAALVAAALGARPVLVSMRRNTPHASAPRGLAGAVGVFNPKKDSAATSSLTPGFVGGAAGAACASAAAVTGAVTAAAAARRVVLEVERATVELALPVDDAAPVDVVAPVEPVPVTTDAEFNRTPWPATALL
jgi:hypothetical protein